MEVKTLPKSDEALDLTTNLQLIQGTEEYVKPHQGYNPRLWEALPDK